jgi:hypothetical protein
MQPNLRIALISIVISVTLGFQSVDGGIFWTFTDLISLFHRRYETFCKPEVPEEAFMSTVRRFLSLSLSKIQSEN